MKKLLTLGAAIVLLTACEETATDPLAVGQESPQNALERGGRRDLIRVLTRNVYVGTDVDAVLAAGSAEQIPVLAAQAFQGLLATDFNERAGALVREIAAIRPHLIGLQEISLIRRQSPGDAVIGGVHPATDTVIDFMSVMREALAARGLHYRVVASVQNADVEVPMLTGTDPLAFDDVRLTDFDVILARHDVAVSNQQAGNYAARLTVPIGGAPPIEILRGYTAVDATIRGRTYRFINTHLEPASIPQLLPLQLAQAEELLTIFDRDDVPTILVGDLNSHAPMGETYQRMLTAGYADVWDHHRESRGGSGDTCCHDTDLLNETVSFDRRIDLVLVRHPTRSDPFRGPVAVTVTGDEQRNRTPSGLWPSDHGGVAAGFRVRR